MSCSNSRDDHAHHPPGRQYSCTRKTTEAHQTKDAQEKRTIVLAMPAINAEQQRKNKRRKKREEVESGEEECGDWAREFAQQLIDANEGRIPPVGLEEQITMIPDPFFKDLLQL